MTSALLALLLVFGAALGTPNAQAQSSNLLRQFEDQVTTFTLDNGLTFVVIERHDAPVVSFHTYADVGAINEPVGQTGLAHIFEHMAFKGTTSIGTTNIEQEMQALRRQEGIYLKLRRAQAQVNPDSSKIRRLEVQFEQATEEAKSYVESNAFDRILQKAGMTGLNASTSWDATNYFYSLPANKVELFFRLESDRFINPVLREFYTERDVVMEERRMRTESTPTGRLLEAFLAAAFKAHPYGRPVVGHMSDLENISRTDARQFFEKYYGPQNLTIALAGDVTPQRVRELAQQYFGSWEGGEEPMPVTTEEPQQQGERRVIIREQTQPYVFIGYHRPSMFSKEDAAYQVLADVLSAGRTSRFHNQLTEEGLALQASAIAAFPGSKYPSLFGVIGVPSRDTAPTKLEEAIYDELVRIKEEGITQEELERAKTKARADLIQRLDRNAALAGQFAQAEALTGSWKNVFRDLRELQNVTADQVQQVAQETFQRSNRTVALIKNTDGEDPATASAE